MIKIQLFWKHKFALDVARKIYLTLYWDSICSKLIDKYNKLGIKKKSLVQKIESIDNLIRDRKVAEYYLSVKLRYIYNLKKWFSSNKYKKLPRYSQTKVNPNLLSFKQANHTQRGLGADLYNKRPFPIKSSDRGITTKKNQSPKIATNLSMPKLEYKPTEEQITKTILEIIGE